MMSSHDAIGRGRQPTDSRRESQREFMIVALTGATGFLGRRTLAALHEQGHAVRALARRKESMAGLEGLAEEWFFGDQYDPDLQTRLVLKIQALIHVAMDWNALNDGPRANLERNL